MPDLDFGTIVRCSPLQKRTSSESDACFFLMEHYNEPGLINIGVGKDISIMELATLIKHIVGFEGEIELDSSKPDGTLQKLMDVSKLNALGWKASTSLKEGVKNVYENQFLIRVNT